MVITALALVGVLAISGLAVDVGRAYLTYEKLQAATQAAALAGGAALSTETAADAISAATSYSAVPGDRNADPINLPNATMVSGYPQVKCLTTIGSVCSGYPSDNNAITVEEQASVPTTFLNVLGISSIPLTVTATAAAGGGYSGPYNVELILDTTRSMTDTDSDSQCNSTRISCAEKGIQTLLGTLWPCTSGQSSCGTASTASLTAGANVSNPVDEAGLMVFPGLVSSSQATKDYICPTSNPTTTPYNNSPAYEIIPFSSDYRVSDTAASLYQSSDLVIAVGGGSCSGAGAPGGQGTFYAGAIDAAQANLVANARPNTKNVIILLSDGDANATAIQMGGLATSYPALQECHQAVAEAQKAAAAGTIVYSVAYGAESAGCATDTSPTITPCETMREIASTPQNFFSDYTQSGSGIDSSCISASRPTTNLNEIFQEIGTSLTVARLIPNSAS